MAGIIKIKVQNILDNKEFFINFIGDENDFDYYIENIK